MKHPQRKMFTIRPCPDPTIDPPDYPCYAIPAWTPEEAAGFWFQAGNSSPITITDTLERRKWVIARTRFSPLVWRTITQQTA